MTIHKQIKLIKESGKRTIKVLNKIIKLMKKKEVRQNEQV